ncbi:indole-3-glycerol phosphate synthase TrpC [Blastopirellula sp. JC732]|uniref:Indole-3-glycerol phosphate synthase n=1 Tax=Blastopirellula sediminis TaxID=2894196 RepID=A0A9X1SGK8_9BACT|nr:indole-3-glycerol phosphate synthase TrpC [Blastopirellula sediminis]MCC9607219.1 indole-3-glycerol phosphate synthase TrpC [Blastopirellula sediminis]MCC9629488.1 indole-3-glycerol phosphate synthase TrpC [Blastopirellula sediminis]
MSTVLDKIVATKREEIDVAKEQYPAELLEKMLEKAPPVRDFFGALAAEGPIKLIAEVKKASPSKGIIREDFNPVEIALAYEAAGATCISCLTDEVYFQGSLDYLREIRKAVGIPVLRKDFILDPYQLLEARVAGADAVLLIAECLDDETLRTLLDGTHELGMTALVELYEPENISRVLASGAKLIGVNNRDLRNFEIDLNHTVRLRQQIPSEKLLVGESGIFTNDDVQLLANAGVDAILVGESLMRQKDIGAAVKTLLGTN